MSFFGKRQSADNTPSNELNAFLGAGTEFRGRLDFEGTVRIDGVFHGEIASSGMLVLGREAVVEGQIQVGRLSSSGRVNGDVVVTSKAVLRKHSTLVGSLRAAALVVEEGAGIEGSVEMSGVGRARSGSNVIEVAGFKQDADTDQETEPAEAQA